MESKQESIQARLMVTFRAEAAEHLHTLVLHLAALERPLSAAESEPALEESLRAVHTLKGAARSVGQTEVESICQVMESLLGRAAREAAGLSQPVRDELKGYLARLSQLLRAEASPTPVAPVATTERPPDPPSIRVLTGQLDALMVRAEELLVERLAISELVGETRALVELIQNPSKPIADRGAPDLELVLRRAQALLQHLMNDERSLFRSVGELLAEMQQLRLAPAATVLDLFPVMVMDLTREQGKEVDLTILGRELDVDRRILEWMKDPLIHLARNALDHGIEPPQERLGAGKPRRGGLTIAIRAVEKSRIEMTVADDGRGIDVSEVKAAAVRARLLDPKEITDLTEGQTLALVYRSGLSTSPAVTRVSGRGLGLAIVRERVERLGGEIRLATQRGRGTSVQITLPASIATVSGLLVHASGSPFLLPAESVDQVLRVNMEQVQRIDGRSFLELDGGLVPLVRLGEALGLQPGPEPDDQYWPAVLLSSGSERVALMVQSIKGVREVVVKELSAPLVRVRNIAGAGLLGTGRIVLLLRPADLIRSRHGLAAASAAPNTESEPQRPKRILVVDDSITTRTMEKNILETAGYHVRTAVDGVEAWMLLHSDPFDLVLSDVDMPRVNGFELTARIRSDPRLARLPVVLVTALESLADKERGISVGADAYLVKSSFDQSNLLEIIHRLL